MHYYFYSVEVMNDELTVTGYSNGLFGDAEEATPDDAFARLQSDVREKHPAGSFLRWTTFHRIEHPESKTTHFLFKADVREENGNLESSYVSVYAAPAGMTPGDALAATVDVLETEHPGRRVSVTDFSRL